MLSILNISAVFQDCSRSPNRHFLSSLHHSTVCMNWGGGTILAVKEPNHESNQKETKTLFCVIMNRKGN